MTWITRKVEKTTLLAFLDSHEKSIGDENETGKLQIALPIGVKSHLTANPLREAAFVDLVHAVANSNDFIYRF